jgi:GT2 family glycosyltransferase
MTHTTTAPAVEEGSSAAGRRVVAVVLTWNDVELTRACLRSLGESAWPGLTVVVVDNGSAKPVREPLQAEFQGVDFVRLERNQGFAGGCNRGIERALQHGADFVFLLNNDTIVQRDAVPQLVRAMQDRPQAGIASAILLNPGEPRTVQSYRGWLDRDRAAIRRPDEDQLLAAEHRATVACEFVSACAILLRTTALQQVGLFDERLFVNWEDYDLCVRMADAGWELLMVGTAEVVHRRHQTTGTTSPYITYFSTRNQLICLARHGRLPALIWNLPYIARSFYWRVRDYGLTNLQCHRASLWAWIDFCTGVRGLGHAPHSTRNARSQRPGP